MKVSLALYIIKGKKLYTKAVHAIDNKVDIQ